VRWRSSQCPSLGCSALGAEPKRNNEDSIDLFGIVLPLLGFDLPLVSRGRLATWRFGGLSLWSTCTRVQEGLAAASYEPW
jgi:hypothetical protein